MRQLVFATTFAVACTTPNDDVRPVDEKNEELPTEFTQATLPAPDDGDCETDPAITVCEWANSVDAVVVATIDSRRPLTTPVWIRGGSLDQTLGQSCSPDDLLKPGVIFDVSVTEVLYGTAPRSIKVHLGPYGLEGWGPTPSLDAGGGFTWHGRASDAGPLEVGTTVGLALTQEPATGAWGLLGELPFTFTADGSVLSRDSECRWSRPDPMPVDFWGLESALKACTRATNARHTERIAQYTSNPARTYAALCLVRSDTPPPPSNEDAGPPDGG